MEEKYKLIMIVMTQMMLMMTWMMTFKSGYELPTVQQKTTAELEISK